LTTADYFERNKGIYFSGPETKLADICLRYLNNFAARFTLGKFEPEPEPETPAQDYNMLGIFKYSVEQEIDGALGKFHFVWYSAYYLVQHLRSYLRLNPTDQALVNSLKELWADSEK